MAGGVAKLVVRGISQDIYASGGRGRQRPAPRHSEQAANAAAARANGQGECEQRRGADSEQRGTPRHPPRAGDGLRTSSRSTRSPGQCERRDRAPPARGGILERCDRGHAEQHPDREIDGGMLGIMIKTRPSAARSAPALAPALAKLPRQPGPVRTGLAVSQSLAVALKGPGRHFAYAAPSVCSIPACTR